MKYNKNLKREDFEAWSSKKQKAYANSAYLAVKKIYLEELMDGETYFCHLCGGILTQMHHMWYRSGCPLWYYFQKKNLFPLCNCCHDKEHGQCPHKDFKEIIRSLKEEHKEWLKR